MDDSIAKRYLFDRWAAGYDILLPSVFYQAVHQRMVDCVELPPRSHVLEIGCGTGKLLQRLAAHWPELTGVGLDFSAEMLHQARLTTSAPDRLSFVQGNSQDLPLADQLFEAVFCSISFLHYLDPVQVMGEVARVLKPDGQFFLADLVPPKCSRQTQVRLPISPGGLRFYSAIARESLGEQARLSCACHVYLLGPVMLSCFRLERAHD